MVTSSTFVLGFARDELWEILVGMLFGVGIGMTYAAMPALIARNVVATELGSAMSFRQVCVRSVARWGARLRVPFSPRTRRRACTPTAVVSHSLYSSDSPGAQWYSPR